MEKLVNTYIAFLEKNKCLSINTLQSYKRDIEQYIGYLGINNIKNVEKTSKLIVQEYLNNLEKKGRANSTISRNLASLRSFYQFTSKKNFSDFDPTTELESPKIEKKTPEILSIMEIEKLLKQPQVTDLKGARDKAMLELLYATGIRVSELINLNLDDIDFENGILRCSGVNKEREIPVGKTALEAIKYYNEKVRFKLISSKTEEALFVNISGNRLSRQGFWKIVKQYKNMADIQKDITPHTLRHSFAAHLVQNGADIKIIKEILGHSDISSTQIYMAFAQGSLKDVYNRTHPRA